MGYSGAGGKLIHKKTRGKNSRDTVPWKFFTDVGDGAKKYKIAIFKPKLSKFRIFWPSPKSLWGLRIYKKYA